MAPAKAKRDIWTDRQKDQQTYGRQTNDPCGTLLGFCYNKKMHLSSFKPFLIIVTNEIANISILYLIIYLIIIHIISQFQSHCKLTTAIVQGNFHKP